MFDFSFQSISNNFCIKKIKKYKCNKKKESSFQCDYVNVIYKFIRQELRTREKSQIIYGYNLQLQAKMSDFFFFFLKYLQYFLCKEN